jgi:hypothetical protein
MLLINPYRFAPSEDADALAYIAAVEAADGQSLENGVKDAYTAFISGCKADGVWSSIKASAILAGARTLNGALKPLTGSAPTNFNFVSGDYNRKTGLLGNGSTKYLLSNRNNNADPQDNFHMSVWRGSVGAITTLKYHINGGPGTTGASSIGLLNSVSQTWCRSSSIDTGSTSGVGFLGISRNSSANYSCRSNNSSTTFSRLSQSPANVVIHLFRRSASAGYLDERIAFYSIGESLAMPLLNNRVSNLMAALAAALP